VGAVEKWRGPNAMALDETLLALSPLSWVSLMSSVLLAALVIGMLLFWARLGAGRIDKTVTWDCGYAAPAARMQYTAGSFAGIITEWFGWILRPVRHVIPPAGPFAKAAFFGEHTPETVLEGVVEPAAAAVMRAAGAARALQRGRSQAYLLYLAAGIAMLGAVVLWGGRS